jgi:hypothetical protein
VLLVILKDQRADRKFDSIKVIKLMIYCQSVNRAPPSGLVQLAEDEIREDDVDLDFSPKTINAS